MLFRSFVVVPFFLFAGDFEVFRLGDFDPAAFFVPFPFFGLGEAELDLEREPDFPFFGLGEAEVFFGFGLGEEEAFLEGEEDSFFSVAFFFREGEVFERPRRAGDFDSLAGRPLLVVPTVPAFFEFLVVRLGDLAVRPLLAGDFDRSSPMSCFRCSRPSSVSLYEARTFSMMLFSRALLKPNLSCLLKTSSSGTSKLAMIYFARAWEDEPFLSRRAVSALIIMTSYLGWDAGAAFFFVFLVFGNRGIDRKSVV